MAKSKIERIILYSDWRNKAVGHFEGGELITIGDLVHTIDALRSRLLAHGGKLDQDRELVWDGQS